MIKKILVVICIWQLLVQNASCQKKSQHKLLIGSDIGATYLNYRDPKNLNSDAKYFTVLSLEPRIGLSVSNRMFVGLQYGRTFYWSNFIELPIIMYYGAFASYNLRDFDDFIEIEKFKVNFRGNVRVNLNYRVTNYGPDENRKFVSFDKHFSIHVLLPSLRGNFELYKSLFFDCGLGLPIYYNTSAKFLRLTAPVPQCGIYYLFGKNKLYEK